MDQSKIERLLRLIILMSCKEEHTIEDISAKLGITPRSVYRYIDTLRHCGFAIDKRKSNLYKLVKLPNSSINFNKLIFFTEEEACIINNLISSLDNSNVLKTTLQKKLCAIYELVGLAELITQLIVLFSPTSNDVVRLSKIKISKAIHNYNSTPSTKTGP